MTIDEQLQQRAAQLLIVQAKLGKLDEERKVLVSEAKSLDAEIRKLFKEKAWQQTLPFTE